MKDKQQKPKRPKVVSIGGGTGTFVVLKGLKYYPLSLTAIVAMSDSGGSNRRIRDEFGLLPTSDIRQCFVALADEDGDRGLMRKLFMYRFEKGNGIAGMTFGNLFMAALTDILGNQKEAIKETKKVLKIRGTVLPVSYTDTHLFAEYIDGTKVSEEHFIDEPTHDGTLPITKIWLNPKADANPDALKAISEADIIILGPGDLFTSIVPNFLVNGISKAVFASKAKKVYILNLMTKYGQTYNFSASDHIATLKKFAKITPDIVVVNTGTIPKAVQNIYAHSHEYPVGNDLPKKAKYSIITHDLIAKDLTEKSATDTLVRSLVRHDSEKLGQVLFEYITSQVIQNI